MSEFYFVVLVGGLSGSSVVTWRDLLFLRFHDLLLSFLVEGWVILSEILGDESVIIYDLLFILMLLCFIIFEYSVHAFRIEFEMWTDSFYPFLVHLIETMSNDISYFEIIEGDILIEVHFDDIGD